MEIDITSKPLFVLMKYSVHKSKDGDNLCFKSLCRIELIKTGLIVFARCARKTENLVL